MKFRVIICFILPLAAGSCAMVLPDNVVRLNFPDLPGHWPVAGAWWHVRHLGGSKQIVEIRRPATDTGTIIRLPRGINTPVTARLHADGLALLTTKPAGAIYPLHAEGFEFLELSWINGFAADSLLKVADNWELIEFLDAARFCDVIVERSDGNPWHIEQSDMLDHLVNRRFSVYSVRKKRSHTLTLPFLSGEWITLNPLDRTLVVQGEGCEIVVYDGFTRYMRISSDSGTISDWISVSSDAEGYTVASSLTGEISVGRW